MSIFERFPAWKKVSTPKGNPVSLGDRFTAIHFGKKRLFKCIIRFLDAGLRPCWLAVAVDDDPDGYNQFARTESKIIELMKGVTECTSPRPRKIPKSRL